MSLWKRVINGVAGLFGGGGEKTVETIARTVDDFHFSDQEKAQSDQGDLASARAMQLASHESQFDVVVDGINRLVRPGVTAWLIGGFVGWWRLPRPGSIDPFWLEIFMIVVTFWFGGRVLLKDLPKAIEAIVKIRQGK